MTDRIIAALRRIRSHRLMLIGMIICLVVAIMALGADLLTTRSPVRTRMRDAFQPPSTQFLFGADHLGRDVFARVMFGARLSLLIGLSTVGVTAIAGTLVGLAAGYFRRLDDILMRLMDSWMTAANA